MTDSEGNYPAKNRSRTVVGAVALVGAGAVVGGILAMTGTASAATTTPTPTPSATSGTSTTTPKWHSNTDPTHEAGESAARAAAEKTADATGVPPAGFGGPGDGHGPDGMGPGGHSNTDPAHEAGESAARAAQEKAADAAAGASTPSSSSTTG